MIRKLVQRYSATPAPAEDDDLAALRAEVERLRAQNDKMRRAMRHCIDCEYRIEVIATRAEEGHAAAGGDPR